MKKQKILIADDEPMIRDGLSEMLKKFNLPISVIGEAKNGTEALTLSKMLEPDIILTDICMPKLSGLKFIKLLRETTDKQIKTIIISGFDEFEYAKTAISLGVSAYLLKPINETELKNTLTECVRGKETEPSDRENIKDTLVESCLKLLKRGFSHSSFDLAFVSRKLSINPDYISRKLKHETGFSFKEWLTKLRIQKSIELLNSRKYPIYEIAEMVGYSNQHYFSTAFKNHTGYSPKQYQELNNEKN